MFGVNGFLKFSNDCLHFLNPFLLNRLLKFMAREDPNESDVVGWALAAGMCLTSLLQVDFDFVVGRCFL